jgi:hypothetical protein
VTDAALAQQPAHLGDDIKRGQAQRLIDYEQSIHRQNKARIAPGRS